MNGWSDERKALPEQTRVLWSSRDEIITHSGAVLFKESVRQTKSEAEERTQTVEKENLPEDRVR